MEQWKQIPGYENLYEISNCGRVRSLFNGKKTVLKQSIGSKGYLLVSLCKKGIQKTHNVHRLVAQAFLPNPQSYPCINHKDECKTNNNVSNLEWCSYYYNNVYGQRLTKSASKKSKPVKCIETGETFSSASSAQKVTGICQSHISSCCNNKRKSAGGFHWSFVST